MENLRSHKIARIEWIIAIIMKFWDALGSINFALQTLKHSKNISSYIVIVNKAHQEICVLNLIKTIKHFSFLSVYTCIQIELCTCTHIRIYAHMHMHMDMDMHTYRYMYMYIQVMYIWRHLYACIYGCVCM